MLSESPSPINSQEEQIRLIKALRESELLRELSELLASSLDLTHILQVLVRRTTEVCEVKRCAVWLLDKEKGIFEPSAYHIHMQDLKRKTIQAFDRTWHQSKLPFHHAIIDQLMKESGMLIVDDLRNAPDIRIISEKFAVRSVLLVALIRDERLLGMMSLDTMGSVIEFTREQQQMARVIGHQAAVAIDHAHLYQEAQEERMRAARLIERAQSIYEVAMAVNSGEDLGTVLDIAAQHLTTILGAEYTTIMHLERDSLVVAATAGEAKGRYIPEPGEVIAYSGVAALAHWEKAARTQLPQYVTENDLQGDELLLFRQLQMQQVLIVPLQVGVKDIIERPTKNGSVRQEHRCVGFALVHYARSWPRPGSGQLAFAQDIAAHCAMAVEKEAILTEARRAVALATERANTLDAVFNAMTEGLIVLDLQGKVMISNNTATNYIGLTRNAKRQLASYLQHHPAYTPTGDLLQQEDFPLTRALRGEHVRGERFMSKGKDGEERTMEVNIVPLYGSEGKQIGIVSAFRNVTEQARDEKHIRMALETMLHTAEVISGHTDLRETLYHVLDVTVKALNCGRGVVQLYDQTHGLFTPLLSVGFSLEEVDQWLIEHEKDLKPCGYKEEIYQQQLQEGHATVLYQQKEGQGPISHVLVTPIRNHERLLGIMMLDRSLHVSEQNEAEIASIPEFTIWDMAVVEGIAQFAALAIEQTHWQQEAEKARLSEATMRETNEMKDEFLAITAHEFRTPLTVILAHSQMMERQLRRARKVAPTLNERLSESISIIEEQTRQLTNIVNTFLEVTRLNRGQIELAQTRLSLDEILKEIITNYRSTVPDREISYHVLNQEEAYLVCGDKARLLQIFANLIQNAIKYSPSGSPIAISMYLNGSEMIEVVIKDEGIGVPSDAQERLFERFYRVPHSGSTARGVGLGLYVVAEFLHLHGGTIRVESSGIPGEGSKFILTLPRTESE